MSIFKYKMMDSIGGHYASTIVNGEYREVFILDYAATEQGKKLRETRKKNSIGLRKAASCIGITASTLSKVEQFKIVVEQEEFDRWIRVLESAGEDNV